MTKNMAYKYLLMCLQSSPLYQHLKQIELEDKGIFGGSSIEGLEDTTFYQDTSTISDGPTEASTFFSFQEVITILTSEVKDNFYIFGYKKKTFES